MKNLLFATFGFFALLSLARGDTTLTNQTETVIYTSNTSANLGKLTLTGTSSLILSDNASVNVSDSTAGQILGNPPGGAETITATNNGSGAFVFTITGTGATYGRSTGATINYVTNNLGSGTTNLDSAVRIGNGGDGNDLTYWAFFDGNDYAMTSSASGGVLEAATTEYNDGNKDTGATNLTTWSSNAYEDYTNDGSSAYSGELTGNAEKHGIRIANAAGATLDLGGHTLIDAGILDAQGAGAVTISDGNLTATGLTSDLIINQNNTANAMTVSANITGSGTAVEKAGVGTLVLSGGNNSYTGTTYINQGTLQLDGTIGSSSNVILQQGAGLSGAGTINAVTQGKGVTVEGPDSVIAPGDPGVIGTLTVNGTITAANGLTLDFTLDGEGAQYGTDNDFLFVSGLNLSGTVIVNITTVDSLVTDTPYFLMGGDNFSGSPTFQFTTPAGYEVESYNYNPGGAFTVEFDAVPEPSTYALIGLGLAGWFGIARMRRTVLLLGGLACSVSAFAARAPNCRNGTPRGRTRGVAAKSAFSATA